MLAQLKEPLVQLRGRWVDVRPGSDRARAGVHPEAPERPRDAAGRGAVDGPGADDASTACTSPTSKRAAGSRRCSKTSARAPAPKKSPRPPKAFEGTLRRYQTARRRLAGHPPALRPGRAAGRRHGAGQDGPDYCAAARRAERSRADAGDLSDVGGRQLAARAGAVCAWRCGCWCTTGRSGRRARSCRGGGAARRGAQHLLAAAPRRGQSSRACGGTGSSWTRRRTSRTPRRARRRRRAPSARAGAWR